MHFIHDTLRRHAARRLAGTTLAALMLAGALTACSRDAGVTPPKVATSQAAPQADTPAAPPVAPASAAVAPPVQPTAIARDDQRKHAWMTAIFGDAYDREKEQALAELEIDGVLSDLLLTLVSATELPDGRIAIVVNGAQADEHGADISGHASSGILNVYVLGRENDAWAVAERREGLAELGSMGNIGGITWITLGTGKPGFIVSSGGVWQGHWASGADIFELGNGVRNLGSLQEGSGNGGACSPDDECWEVDSEISVAAPAAPDGYADLLVDFKGKRYSYSEDKDGNKVEHLKETIGQRARYRFDGKAYVLSSGTNPVPEI